MVHEAHTGAGDRSVALLMALPRRNLRQRVLIHYDQGAQFGSDDWRGFCREYHLELGMSQQWQLLGARSLPSGHNTVAESFFRSLKKERIRKRVYKTGDLARADIFDYTEAFYNRTRRHSHPSGVSPQAFEQASL